MIGLFVGGVALFVTVLVVGVVFGALALVFSLVLLPLKLLGFAFRGLAFVLTIPFLIVLGVLAVVVLGAGLLAAFAPFLALAALVGLPIWLLRRKPRAVA